VAVALKRHTNKTYYIQNTDNIHIKYTKQQKHKTTKTQNIHIKYKYHTKYNTEKRKGSKK
jgi:hypothetical protein